MIEARLSTMMPPVGKSGPSMDVRIEHQLFDRSRPDS
jgi:hypothetical protein